MTNEHRYLHQEPPILVHIRHGVRGSTRNLGSVVRWINRHNIDPVIAQAVMTDDYEAIGDISVSRLVKPPQITALEHQYEEEIVQDVTDSLFALEGRALHHILATGRGAPEGKCSECGHLLDTGVPEVQPRLAVLQEHRLTVECNGWQVSGQFDVLYQDTRILKDYKVSSVWSHMFGGKQDWEMQLNFYAYLAFSNKIEGLPLDELRVVMWLRDWAKSHVERDRDYPPLKVIEHVIPQWPLDYVAHAFDERVQLHQLARAGTYPPCTSEERWARPDSWAVQKPDAKKAYRVFEEPAMAKAMAGSMSGYEVQYRPGVNTRCASYCTALPFCQQAKELGVVKDEG